MPVRDGGQAFLLGALDGLSCVGIETGEPLWRQNRRAEFGADGEPMWGAGSAPVAAGDRLVLVGEDNGARRHELDAQAQRPIWIEGRRDLESNAPLVAPPDRLLVVESAQVGHSNGT